MRDRGRYWMAPFVALAVGACDFLSFTQSLEDAQQLSRGEENLRVDAEYVLTAAKIAAIATAIAAEQLQESVAVVGTAFAVTGSVKSTPAAADCAEQTHAAVAGLVTVLSDYSGCPDRAGVLQTELTRRRDVFGLDVDMNRYMEDGFSADGRLRWRLAVQPNVVAIEETQTFTVDVGGGVMDIANEFTSEYDRTAKSIKITGVGDNSAEGGSVLIQFQDVVFDDCELGPSQGRILVTERNKGTATIVIESCGNATYSAADGGDPVDIGGRRGSEIFAELVAIMKRTLNALAGAFAGDTLVIHDPVEWQDSDGDGLSDAEEADLGTDPDVPDTDGDGLNDGDEVHTTLTNPLDSDTDRDGLSDGEEVGGANGYVTNPLNPDTDADGVPDGEEVNAGFDPTDGTSWPIRCPDFPNAVFLTTVPYSQAIYDSGNGYGLGYGVYCFVPSMFGYNLYRTSGSFPAESFAAHLSEPAGDDNSFLHTLMQPVRFYGVPVSTVYVDVNGYIGMGAGYPDYSGTIAEFTGASPTFPRVAPFWLDLATNTGGAIYFQQDASRVVVTYDQVAELNSPAYRNSAQVQIYTTGEIVITYGTVLSYNFIAGISPNSGDGTSFLFSDQGS